MGACVCVNNFNSICIQFVEVLKISISPSIRAYYLCMCVGMLCQSVLVASILCVDFLFNFCFIYFLFGVL